MMFRNGYRWNFAVQNNKSLWTAPACTSQTILYYDAFIKLKIIRLVFNCSYPTIGVSWDTYIPWDLSKQQPKYKHYSMHIWVSLGWQTSSRKEKGTSEALAERSFQGKQVFLKCKLREVTEKEEKWGNCIHVDAVKLD